MRKVSEGTKTETIVEDYPSAACSLANVCCIFHSAMFIFLLLVFEAIFEPFIYNEVIIY